jgi:hypothetical protein
MKLAIIYLAAICLITGCGKQSAPSPIPQFEAASLEFHSADKMRVLKYDHYRLLYDVGRQQMQTNIVRFEQAANILGAYGWELVNAETVQGGTIYHLKRQKQADGHFFFWPE